jgi:hypothetical protein
MKRAIVTALVMFLGLTGTAFAQNQSVDASFGVDTDPAGFSKRTATPKFGLSYSYQWDNGFNLGASLSTSQKAFGEQKVTDTSNTKRTIWGGMVDENQEIKAGYKYNIWGPVTVGAQAAVGYRETYQYNYPYYALYGNADVKINDSWTWNAVSYRYRTSFDKTLYGWNSQQLTTGVTYKINNSYSVYAKVNRGYSENWKTASSNGAAVGIKINF